MLEKVRCVKILVTGVNGQVGFELTRSLKPLGEIVAADRRDCDFTRPQAVSELVRATAPAMIVNAAAYTAVDEAEADEATAMLVNATAPGVLAAEARRCGALLLHYSTDYVFDGAKPEAYVETDSPAPLKANLSLYGSGPALPRSGRGPLEAVAKHGPTGRDRLASLQRGLP